MNIIAVNLVLVSMSVLIASCRSTRLERTETADLATTSGQSLSVTLKSLPDFVLNKQKQDFIAVLGWQAESFVSLNPVTGFVRAATKAGSRADETGTEDSAKAASKKTLAPTLPFLGLHLSKVEVSSQGEYLRKIMKDKSEFEFGGLPGMLMAMVSINVPNNYIALPATDFDGPLAFQVMFQDNAVVDLKLRSKEPLPDLDDPRLKNLKLTNLPGPKERVITDKFKDVTANFFGDDVRFANFASLEAKLTGNPVMSFEMIGLGNQDFDSGEFNEYWLGAAYLYPIEHRGAKVYIVIGADGNFLGTKTNTFM
ncbi:MAG: hypothetical protein NTV34_05540 [Proteobacteria bacterium]|nr:hypothetical protein [Pseudomonadota bacterium]